jgi:EmrB/QacA subfamily drug resistance transporter
VELSRTRRRTITVGVLLGMALGALEATVVGTAMPTVIASLGGLEHYSWVFSAYLLTSTASVPIWGRLADLHGRRRLYLVGVAVFVGGSVLSGAAQSMTQLVAFRAIQGLGAGALVPLAMTIIGEIYTVQERPRVQAASSGLWGLASITGPLVGGWLTDTLSWRWVFFINLPFGLLTAIVIGTAYPEPRERRQVTVDWAGAWLLFGTVASLLAGLSIATAAIPWFTLSLVLAGLLVAIERQVKEPILPFALFRNPIVRWSLPIVFLQGMGLFGAVAFIPLLVQGGLGGTATEAGRALTPLFLGWVTTAIVGARLTLVVGYRPITWLGIVAMGLAFAALARTGAETPHGYLVVASLGLGAGMGFTMLSLLLAIQHGVARADLGLATSLNQFSRSVGAAVGVALMGTVLSILMGPSGEALARAGSAHRALQLDPATAARLVSALRVVFGIGAAISAVSVLPALALPPLDFTRRTSPQAGEQLLAAELATLEPADEPSSLRDER